MATATLDPTATGNMTPATVPGTPTDSRLR